MAGKPTSRGKGFQDERYASLIGRLVDARKDAGLNQREFAVKIGRHQQFVSRYETGERRLDIVEFVDIARSLNIKPSDMINLVPE